MNLVLNFTYFTFNNKTYKQIFGTLMGSPLSPILADIVMQENEAIKRLSCDLQFYFRYVDDILLSAPKKYVEDILETFNSIHKRLKFSLELSNKNCINFLNVLISNESGILTFDLYFKPTFSERFLNFHSYHPLTHKKSVIISLVNRIMLLSHPKFHKKNFTYIINILLKKIATHFI